MTESPSGDSDGALPAASALFGSGLGEKPLLQNSLIRHVAFWTSLAVIAVAAAIHLDEPWKPPLLAGINPETASIAIWASALPLVFVFVFTNRKTRHAENLEHRFRNLLSLAPDALIIVNRESRIVLANAAAERQFGYRQAELIGQPIEILIPDELKHKHRQHRTDYMNNPHPRPMGLGMELNGVRKDSSRFPAEISLGVLDSAEGMLVTAAVRDITERKQFIADIQKLNGELEKQAARFRHLVAFAPDALVIVDKTGSIVLVNSAAERQFGYAQDELIGRPVEILIPEEVRARHVGHRNDFIDNPQPRPMGVGLELYGIRKDGSRFPAEISLGVLKTDDGPLITAAVRDITERRRHLAEIEALNENLERQAVDLRAAVKDLEAFSYSVSHDLRAPLRAMDGFAQAVIEDAGENLDAQSRNYLDRIRSASTRMGEIVDALLLLSKIGRTEAQRTAIDLSAMATEIGKELTASWPDRSVELTVEPNIGTNADEALLRIALTNLMSNAWKFTRGRAPGRVTFGTLKNANVDTFYLKDNGAGFDMRYVDKLFKPFQRLHKVSEFEGTGIGLATVARIVQKHDGSVWAEATDEGTTVYFTLAVDKGGKDDEEAMGSSRGGQSG